ncbi:MAG: hypothetical protein EZS28_000910 [Streblomastix strix]|uniref:Uncharacterized protein n=1 Tax=Streblomastix strix TaxID=222440 RepID=A0A5J4X8T2_9EUKA|nr:MAG: hypothetical protein EZS28_000910 [Streblomastix strix]
MMISPLEALKELCCWIGHFSPQERVANFEPEFAQVHIAPGAYLSVLTVGISNRKELQAIHLGIITFAKICKELQITNLLIWSDNSTAAFDL